MMTCFTSVKIQALATVLLWNNTKDNSRSRSAHRDKTFADKSPTNLPLPYHRGLPRSRASKASLPSKRSVQSRCKNGEVASSSCKERTLGGTTELNGTDSVCTRNNESKPRFKRAGFPVDKSST